MRAGQGLADMPAYEGESALHYVWRICQKRGWDVGPEPPAMEEPHPRRRPEARQPGEDG